MCIMGCGKKKFRNTPLVNNAVCREVFECFVGCLGRIPRIGSRCSFPRIEKRNRKIFWGLRPLAETLESL
jgi:hypothetical protein